MRVSQIWWVRRLWCGFGVHGDVKVMRFEAHTPTRLSASCNICHRVVPVPDPYRGQMSEGFRDEYERRYPNWRRELAWMRACWASLGAGVLGASLGGGAGMLAGLVVGGILGWKSA